jgi:hypothetical protein
MEWVEAWLSAANLVGQGSGGEVEGQLNAVHREARLTTPSGTCIGNLYLTSLLRSIQRTSSSHYLFSPRMPWR